MTLFNLPIYQSHKRVGAAEIVAISAVETGGAVLTLLPANSALDGTIQIQVDAAWLARNPEVAVGGMFVQYIENEDHYTAFSPAQPFEDGYTLEGDTYAADETDSQKQEAKNNIALYEYHTKQSAAIAVAVINLGQDITDIKLILSRIETTAINDAHMVPPLVAQANEKLDGLYEFFNPGEDEGAFDHVIEKGTGITEVMTGVGPTGASSPADEAADQGQPAEQAADTQEEKPVEQPTEGEETAQGPA